MDDGDALAFQDFVEGVAELAVAIMDQVASVRERVGDREVACLLGDPGPGRVGGDTREMDAAGREFDEEEDVVAAESERLDSEEVAGDDARGLLAEELLPAETDPAWRWFDAGREEDAADGAR